MKKLIFAAISVLAAAALTACGTSSPVTEAVTASTEKQIENMTLEAAAGTYELSEMTEIGKEKKITTDSYTENVLTLAEDGSYTLSVASGSHKDKKTGVYSLTADGVLTLDDGKTALVAMGEKITCDGETLIAAGSLGAQLKLTMVYKKATN